MALQSLSLKECIPNLQFFKQVHHQSEVELIVSNFAEILLKQSFNYFINVSHINLVKDFLSRDTIALCKTKLVCLCHSLH
jgi:hypothetical protein